MGGESVEWKGYARPGKGQPAQRYASMAEPRRHVVGKRVSLARVLLDNEMAVFGRLILPARPAR